MHLVSEVRRPPAATDRDAFDAVRAVFPAGTLSGAPKVRAMQAIAELEGERRGPYGGAVGFFSPDDVECAITIRSVVLRDGIAPRPRRARGSWPTRCRSGNRPRWPPRRRVLAGSEAAAIALRTERR